MVSGSFQKLEKIGEGTYGIVYKARDKDTGKLVALKKIRPESENEGIPATTIREILLLKNLKHSTIVDLIEVVHSEERMYLVFEYVETDLKRTIDNLNISNKVFEPIVLKKMAYQLVTAVSFCHSRNIFHRDLKPQNILIDSNFNIKLADFGLGRAANLPLRSYTSEIITLWYRPPELLLGVKYYDASVDIWSLGCILAEMYLLAPLFAGDSEIDQLYKIFMILGTPTNEIWDGVESLPKYNVEFPVFKKKSLKSLIKDRDLESLILKMLFYNPLSRIPAKEALEDSYFYDQEPILE